MATSEQGDYTLAWLSLMIAVGIGFVFGLVTHSFIVAANLFVWLKGRPVLGPDKVIASIGFSRLVFQLGCLFQMFFALFLKNKYLDFFWISMQLVSNYSNIWLTALLSVFFSLKISNFHNALFLKMKTIVSQRAVQFIAGCVVVSIVHGLLHTLITSPSLLTNATKFFNGEDDTDISRRYFQFFILVNALPFLIYLLASILVVFFLFLHMNQINRSNSSFSLAHYYTALKSVAGCFLCYALHVGSNLVVFYYIFSLSTIWINVILNIFPFLHSLILIYKTPTLKTQFLKLLQYGPNCAFTREDSEPRSRDV